MSDNAIPYYEILDVIKLQRGKVKIKTENKPCYAISCRISGESLFFYKNNRLSVRVGDVLYVPKNATYEQETEGEELICLHLSVVGRTAAELGVYEPKSEKTVTLFKKAYEIWTKKESNYAYRALSVLYEIIAETDVGVCKNNDSLPPLLAPIVTKLEASLFSPDLSLEAICKNAYIGRTYFNKLFKDSFGVPPVVWINEQRIRQAKKLLLVKGYTNEEIARLCGFRDVKYFYVLFKKCTGMTTKQYKANHA